MFAELGDCGYHLAAVGSDGVQGGHCEVCVMTGVEKCRAVFRNDSMFLMLFGNITVAWEARSSAKSWPKLR